MRLALNSKRLLLCLLSLPGLSLLGGSVAPGEVSPPSNPTVARTREVAMPRSALLVAKGCEAVVVEKGVGTQAYSVGGTVVLGEDFFDGSWTEQEVCAIYWHEQAHVLLGHTDWGPHGEDIASRELAADRRAVQELIARGGAGCALVDVFHKLMAAGHAGAEQGYPLMALRIENLEDGTLCSANSEAARPITKGVQ